MHFDRKTWLFIILAGLFITNAVTAELISNKLISIPIEGDIFGLKFGPFVTVIGILVFSVMFWSIFHHRKSKGVKPAKFSHSTTVEIIWTLIPFAIIVALAIPATN